MQKRQLREINIDDLIIDDADNARVKPVGVEGLAESIKKMGLINPITVAEEGEGKFRVVAGFNRAHAAKRANLEKIPAVVDTSGPKDRLLLQLSENLDRNEFTPYETAVALQRLVDTGMTRMELSTQVHRSQAWVSNYLGYFDLPDEVQELVKSDPENYPVSHIRCLHAMQKNMEPEDLMKVAKKIAGASQKNLAALRKKQETEEGTETATTTNNTDTEVRALPAPHTDIESVEETEGPRVRRDGETVMAAIEGISQLAAEAEERENEVGIARLRGAIEALQWMLGDDAIPLFEDLGLDTVNG